MSAKKSTTPPEPTPEQAARAAEAAAAQRKLAEANDRPAETAVEAVGELLRQEEANNRPPALLGQEAPQFPPVDESVNLSLDDIGKQVADALFRVGVLQSRAVDKALQVGYWLHIACIKLVGYDEYLAFRKALAEGLNLTDEWLRGYQLCYEYWQAVLAEVPRDRWPTTVEDLRAAAKEWAAERDAGKPRRTRDGGGTRANPGKPKGKARRNPGTPNGQQNGKPEAPAEGRAEGTGGGGEASADGEEEAPRLHVPEVAQPKRTSPTLTEEEANELLEYVEAIFARNPHEGQVFVGPVECEPGKPIRYTPKGADREVAAMPLPGTVWTGYA